MPEAAEAAIDSLPVSRLAAVTEALQRASR